MWPDKEEVVAATIADMTARAAAYGRTLRFGYRAHVIVRDTETEARAAGRPAAVEARRRHGADIRAKSLDSASTGVKAQAALRENASSDGYAEDNLWTGIGRARSGCGAAIVGDPDQVLAKLQTLSRHGHRGVHPVGLSARRRGRSVRAPRAAATCNTAPCRWIDGPHGMVAPRKGGRRTGRGDMIGNMARPLVVGIGGTTTAGSSTERALELALRAAADHGVDTLAFTGEALAALPLYTPGAMRLPGECALVDAVRRASGIVIASPGYHGSVSGLVKNAIDLLEETAKDARVYLADVPVGLIATAYGWQATGTTVAALRAIVHALRGWPTPFAAGINSSQCRFDADGGCSDPAVAEQLAMVGRQVAAAAVAGSSRDGRRMTAMRIVARDGGFDVTVGDTVVLRHRPDFPALFVGRGRADVDMYRGNYFLSDRLDARIPLAHAIVEGDTITLGAAADAAPLLRIAVAGGALMLTPLDPGLNRLWLRCVAEPGERLWGGGEQMSYFDMRGRRFPLWTSEPGVGRDKTSEITFKADVSGKSGGDYYNTNYPQPTYLSSRALCAPCQHNSLFGV